MFLKASTACTITLGPFVDSTDGVTAENSLTIAQADVRLSKNGGTLAAKNDASNAAVGTLGYYYCDLNATDTGTLGRLQICVSESGAVPVWDAYTILPGSVYDSLITETGSLYVSLGSVTSIGAAVISIDTVVGNASTTLASLDSAVSSIDTVVGTTSGSVTSIGAVTISIDTVVGNASTTLASIDGAIAGLNDFDPAADQVIVQTNNDKTGYTLTATNMASILETVVEGSLTLAGINRLLLAGIVNVCAGGGTANLTARDFANAKNRITLVVDANGNRTSSTVDQT